MWWAAWPTRCDGSLWTLPLSEGACFLALSGCRRTHDIVLTQGALPIPLVALILGRDALLVGGCFALRARELGWHWPGMAGFFRIGSADDEKVLVFACISGVAFFISRDTKNTSCGEGGISSTCVGFCRARAAMLLGS